MPVLSDSQVIAFVVVAGLLTMTPGADTMLVIRHVMARGRFAGVMTTLGSTGVFIHALLSAVGLAVILVRSATAFEVVKVMGAAYLVWLGIQSLRQAFKRGQTQEVAGFASPAPPVKAGRCFLEGLLSNVLNPKVAVFYLAFLPQFMSVGDWVLGKSVLLAAIHWTENVVWLSFLSVVLEKVRSWITQPRVRRTIEATTGTLFIAFGVRLAMERR